MITHQRLSQTPQKNAAHSFAYYCKLSSFSAMMVMGITSFPFDAALAANGLGGNTASVNLTKNVTAPAANAARFDRRNEAAINVNKSSLDVGKAGAFPGNLENSRYFNQDQFQNFSNTDNKTVSVNAADAGLTGFVPVVAQNSGVVNAKLGKVNFNSGEAVTIDLHGDGLVELEVHGQLADTLAKQGEAGPVIQVSALTAKGAVDNIVNVENIAAANTVQVQGGKIVLSSGGDGVNHPGVEFSPRVYPAAFSPRKIPTELTKREYPGVLTTRKYPGELTPRIYPGELSPRKYPGVLTTRKYPGELTPRIYPGEFSPRKYPGVLTTRKYPGELTPRIYPGEFSPRKYPGVLTTRKYPGVLTTATPPVVNVPAGTDVSAPENIEDFFNEFGDFSSNLSGLNITVTGLPSVAGPANAGGTEALAAIEPAAGEESSEGTAEGLAGVEPAAGEGGNAAACWSDVANAAGSGAVVNYSFGGSFEESLTDASDCGGQGL